MQNQYREPKIEVWGGPEPLGAWATGDALTVTPPPHAALDLGPTVFGIHLENARPFTFSPEPHLFHTPLCHHAVKTHIYVLPPCWWAQMIKNSLTMHRPGFNPWVRIIPWRREWPLQHTHLENSMDRGDWWAEVHGITKSWTQLSE